MENQVQAEKVEIVSQSEKTAQTAFMISVMVSSLLALVVVCVPVIASLRAGYEIPETIDKWGGIILGYYFGSMTGVFMNKK